MQQSCQLKKTVDNSEKKMVRPSGQLTKNRKDAKITIDKDRGTVGFHSLRHSFGSMLAASGVHPKTAQQLMRHSDINLTMSRYTHVFRGQETQAINSLPDLDAKPGSELAFSKAM